MKINKDYMMVMRRGKWLDKQTYRGQQESGVTVGVCIVGCILIIMIAAMFGGIQ